MRVFPLKLKNPEASTVKVTVRPVRLIDLKIPGPAPAYRAVSLPSPAVDWGGGGGGGVTGEGGYDKVTSGVNSCMKSKKPQT